MFSLFARVKSEDIAEALILDTLKVFNTPTYV